MDKRIQEIVNNLPDKLVVVGVRNSPNKIGVYDDTVYIFENKTMEETFSWNTDPSVNRTGVATLVAGKIYRYKPGIHGLSKPPEGRYRAFVQASPVTVHRANEGFDTGFFGINLHRGGENGTSSLGCQTISPGNFNDFRLFILNTLDRHDQADFPYVLLDESTMALDLVTQKSQNAPSYQYVINGKSLAAEGVQVKTIAGRGYGIARTIASLVSGQKREAIPFIWNQDDLVLNKVEIDYADIQESVTWASIGDIAKAYGADVTVDNTTKIVRINKG